MYASDEGLELDQNGIKAGSKDQSDLYTMNPLDFINQQIMGRGALPEVKEVLEEDEDQKSDSANPFDKDSDGSSNLFDYLKEDGEASENLSQTGKSDS